VTPANGSTLGQTAGIMVYQDDDHFIYLGREFSNGTSQLVFYQENGASSGLRNTVPETGVLLNPTVYLRITKTGSLYQASYSYDNVNFAALGPGLAPTAVPTSTATATATATGTVTPVATATTAPTSTSTPGPTGYTATYALPRVGVFAWGGTNAAVSSAMFAADFDWFRVGANSLTPAPSPTATATGTAAPTSTSTATAVVPTGTAAPTSTATAVPPTATSTATAAATSTSTATATATAVPTNTPIPTPTPRPRPRAKFGFSYVSVWYHYIYQGTVQHVQIQARQKATQGIWTTIQFANGRLIRFYTNTDKKGFWQADFRIPYGTKTRSSGRAVVTFQLWRGNRTTKSYTTFTVI
jgi:regulation of enolase protein 1 (concanavalin A-like superfamily)